MLKMLHGKAKDEQWNNQIKEKLSPSLQEEIPFQDAAWPLPFVPGLEYNSPAHGTWNIVHMGMLLPGSHQIYVCGANCNRGVRKLWNELLRNKNNHNCSDSKHC